MRFLLDENFPKAAVTTLRGAGHEIHDFRGSEEQGIPDVEVFQKAQGLHAVLLTTDRDFFHTIPHLFPEHCGVVVIALRKPNRETILSRLDWLLSRVDAPSFANRAFQLRDNTWLAYPPLV